MTLEKTPTPDLEERPRPEEQTGKKGLNLNLPGLLAGAAAAATVAVIGGRLSVAGTVFGAALTSLVSGVALALYSASFEKGRHGLRKVHATVTRRVRGRSGLDATDSDGSTPVSEGDTAGGRWRNLRLKPVLISTGIVIGLAVAAIFGIQLLTGTELSTGTGQIQRTVTGTDSVAPREAEAPAPGTQPAPGADRLAPAEGTVPTGGVPTDAAAVPAEVPAEGAVQEDAATGGEVVPADEQGSGGQQPEGGTGADGGTQDSGGTGAQDTGAQGGTGSGAAPAAP